MKYYVFSSAVSSIASLSEVDKSLAAINFDDNGGVNYTYNLIATQLTSTLLNNSYCGSLTSVSFEINGPSINGASSYLWQSGADTIVGVSNIPGETGLYLGAAIINIPIKYFRRISNNGDTSSWLKISLSGVPIITNATSANICSGSSTSINLTSSISSTFAWTLGTNTGSITGASGSSGSLLNQTLTNPSNANVGSIVYNVTPTSTIGSCVGATVPITVTVRPKPSLTNSNTASICSGTSPNITLTASAASTFAWTLGTNTGSITGAGANNGSTINQTLINPSNALAGSIVYNVTPTSTTGSCAGSPTAITVNVNPTPALSNASTASICSGTSPNITLSSSAISTYTWTLGTNTGSISGASASNGGSINQTLTNPSNTNVGSIIYNIIPTSTTGSCVGNPTAITVTVNPRPSVTNPTTASICSGTSPNITLTASATSTFTWTLGTNTGSISGASASNGSSINQTLTNPSNTNVGSIIYNVTPTSTVGSCVGSPTAITITVKPLPTASISGTTAVCKNSSSPNITFTGASGTAPYTFTYNINGGTNTTVSTTSGNSITVAASTANAGTFTYNLVSVQDASSTSCSQAQSGSATITVNPLPTASISGTTTKCKNSSSPNIIFTGASGTAPYTFTYNINGGSNTTVSTTSGNSVAVAASTANAGTFTFNLVSVQDASSTACSQSQSGSATITVSPLPTASISGTTAVCKNASSPNITFTGASGTAPYTFTYNINGGTNTTVSTTSGNSVTVAASTANAGTFTYNLVSVQDASSTACSQTQSGSATITVNPLPTTSISGTITVCRNSSSPNITFTGASGTAPYTFTYNINGGTNTTVSTTSGSSVTLSASTSIAGTFTYNLVSVQDASSTSCSQAQSGSATVTINPIPNYTGVTSQTICSSTATNISLTANTIGGTNTFAWTTAAVSGINGNSNSNGSTIAQTLNISNSVPTNVVYNVTPAYTYNSVSCIGTAANVTITVNPRPLVNSSTSQTICSGLSNTVNLSNNTSGGSNTFSWSTLGNSNLTGFNTNGTTSTIGSHTISNTSTTPQNLVYSITPTFTNNSVSCAGTSSNYTYTINPIPSVTSPSSQTVCSGVSSSVSLTASTSGGTNTFVWSTSGNSNLSGYGASGTTSQIGPQTIINNASNTQTLTYNITPTFTNNSVSCTGSSLRDTFIINPRPIITSSSSRTVCSGVASFVSLTANTSGGTNSFVWSTIGNSNLSGFNVSGSTSTIGSHTIINNANNTQTLTYSITPTFTNNSVSCSGTSSNITYTVNPRPNYKASTDTTICSNTVLNFNMSSNTTGTNYYTWRTSQVPNVSGNNPYVDSAFSLSRILVNSDSTTRTVIYKVLAKNTQPGQPSCYAADSAIINVYVNPIPIIRINSRPVQPICSGTNLIINLSNSSYGSGINSWDWGTTFIGGGTLTGYSNANNQTSGSVNQLLSNSGAVPGIVRYAITPKYTLNNITCIGSSNLQDIVVNPTPKLSIVNNDTVLCNGNTSSLIFNTNTTGAINRFVWTIANNTGIMLLDSSSTTNTIDLLNSNTSFNYVRRFATDINNADQKSLSIQVLPQYVNGSVCDGLPKSTTIYMNPIPIVKTIFGQNNFTDTTICSGTILNMSVNTDRQSGSSVNNSFLWESNISQGTGLSGNTAKDSSNIFSKTYTLQNASKTNGELTYTITPYFTKDYKTCSGGQRNFIVTINPIPNVYLDDSINFGSSKQVICSGTSFKTTKFKTDYDVSKTRFDWSKTNLTTIQGLKDTGSGNITSSILTNNQINPDSVLYSITPRFINKNITCAGNSISTKIIVNPKPQIIGALSQTICSGASTSVPLKVNTNLANTSISWNTVGNTKLSEYLKSDTNFIIGPHKIKNNDTANQNLVYKIIPTYKNNGRSCIGDTANYTYNVLSTPFPNASFTFSQSQGNVLFTPSQSGLTYKWYFGDGDSSILSNPSHTYKSNGVYNVKLMVENSNNCSNDTAIMISLNTVGIDITERQILKMYPNPTIGHIIIESHKTISTVEVLDITGKSVSQLTNLGHLDIINLDLSGLANGVYFISSQNVFGNRIMQKVLIQK